MPEAKFQIKRKCEVCGNTFIAKTLDSRYCCRHCTDIAYKNRKAAKAKEEQLNQIAQLIPSEREFISVKEAVAMYAISRDTIYRLVRKGRLPYINIGERLTRISREQLEKMVPLREEPIKDEHFATTSLRHGARELLYYRRNLQEIQDRRQYSMGAHQKVLHPYPTNWELCLCAQKGN